MPNGGPDTSLRPGAAQSQKKTEISYLLPSLEGEAAEVARKQRSKRKKKHVQRLARRQIFIMSATMTLATRWKDGTQKIRKWNPGPAVPGTD